MAKCRSKEPAYRYNVVMVRAEQVIDSWKGIRQDTIIAVEEFPAGEFGFRPAPYGMTFGELARHILDAGDGLTGMLLAEEESLATPDFREKLKLHLRNIPADADPPALAAALRESVEERAAALARQTAGFYAEVITRFRWRKGDPPGNAANHQGTRIDASRSAFPLLADERNCAGAHTSPNG